MHVKPIKTEADHDAAPCEVERLWGAEEGTANGDRLDVLATLIEAYEETHFPIDMPDPIDAIRFLDAIRFRLEQRGEDKKALVGIIGNRTHVYEGLRRDRPLSLAMIRRLNNELRIPPEVLIRPARVRRKRHVV
jgi:HTH-type transcriptional regulator / antitoxin HigA